MAMSRQIESATIGYVIAERILRRSSTCFSIVSASRIRTASSTPPISPERTIAM